MALSISETIRLLLPDGTVKRLPLEDYIRGVVAAALPADTPLEAMKALAVAARTFAANTHRHLDRGADVCTLRHCQAWSARANPRAARAVLETRSIVALYKDALIEAFYFDHCDGKTRDSMGILINAPAYLKSVTCPCGSASLKGHGIGMCKRGMIVLARLGEPYQIILKHYYTGIALEQLTIDPNARAPEARPHAFRTGTDLPPPAAPPIPTASESRPTTTPRPTPAPRRPVVAPPKPEPATDRAKPTAAEPTPKAPTAAPKPAAAQPATTPPVSRTAVPRGSTRPKPEQAPPASASESTAPPPVPAEPTPAAPAPSQSPPEPTVAASAPPPVQAVAPIVMASALTDQPQAEEADELLYYLAVEDIPPPAVKPAEPPPAPVEPPAPVSSPAPSVQTPPPTAVSSPASVAPPPFELPPASMPEEMPTALNLEFIAPPSFLPEAMPGSYDDMLGVPPTAPPATVIEPNLDDFMPPVEKFYTPLDAPPSIPEGLPAFDSTVRAEDTPFAWVAPPPLYEEDHSRAEPRILLDALPGPRIIAGNLPKAGVIVTIRDARGNSIVTVSGVARQYGAGGFEAPLTDDGAYHVKFDGTELDVKLENETVFIYAT